VHSNHCACGCGAPEVPDAEPGLTVCWSGVTVDERVIVEHNDIGNISLEIKGTSVTCTSPFLLLSLLPFFHDKFFVCGLSLSSINAETCRVTGDWVVTQGAKREVPQVTFSQGDPPLLTLSRETSDTGLSITH